MDDRGAIIDLSHRFRDPSGATTPRGTARLYLKSLTSRQGIPPAHPVRHAHRVAPPTSCPCPALAGHALVALILPTWPGILYLRPRTRAAVHIWRLRPKISTQSLGERSSGGSPGTSHRHPLPPQDRSRYFPPRRLVPNPTVAVSHQPRKTSNGLRPGTIRRSLAGLRSFHTDTGLDDAAFDSTQLGRVLRGIRGDAGALERRLRIPITLPILASILSAHRSLAGVSDRDRVGLSAAYAVAYVGAFRSGELTYGSGDFDPSFYCSRSDVRDCGDYAGEYAVVRLPSSKSDPYRKGVDIIIPSAPPKRPRRSPRLTPSPPAVQPRGTQLTAFCAGRQLSISLPEELVRRNAAAIDHSRRH